MTIADAQARQWIIDVLKNVIENLEGGSEIPFERSPQTALMLQVGPDFRDDDTNQEFYPAVFVAVSESEAERQRIAVALREAFRLQ